MLDKHTGERIPFMTSFGEPPWAQEDELWRRPHRTDRGRGEVVTLQDRARQRAKLISRAAQRTVWAAEDAVRRQPFEDAIFCTVCGVEVDQEHKLSRNRRAFIRRCTTCAECRHPGLEVKYCHHCGGRYTLEEYRGPTTETSNTSVMKGWGTWSTHPDCHEALRQRLRQRENDARRAGIEARTAYIVYWVSQIEEAELRAAVARHMHITLPPSDADDGTRTS